MWLDKYTRGLVRITGELKHFRVILSCNQERRGKKGIGSCPYGLILKPESFMMQLQKLKLAEVTWEVTESQNIWGWKGPLDITSSTPRCQDRVPLL